MQRERCHFTYDCSCGCQALVGWRCAEFEAWSCGWHVHWCDGCDNSICSDCEWLHQQKWETGQYWRCPVKEVQERETAKWMRWRPRIPSAAVRSQEIAAPSGSRQTEV